MLYKGSVAQEKVSAFGKYEGYSEAIYDGGRRTSDYLPLSNGTRLAYDLILPTRKGNPAGGRLPVLFKYTPYLRTFTIFDKEGKNIIADLYDLGWKERAMLRIRYWLSDQGRFMTPCSEPVGSRTWSSTGMPSSLSNGWDRRILRATQPSFEAGAREANEILDWIASQKWCNGNIGMFATRGRAKSNCPLQAPATPT